MKLHSIFTATALAAALALAGCAGEPKKEAMAVEQTADEPSPEARAAEAAIAAAKSALKEANKTGFAWRDTGKMIKDAEAALAKGDSAGATKLAKKAETQSKLAINQSRDQAKAGPHF